MFKYLYSSIRKENAFPYLSILIKDFKQVRTIKPIALRAEEIEHLQLVHTLTIWTVSPDLKSISKTFKFENFEAAFSFMNAVAQVSQEMDRILYQERKDHPDWYNCYNTVTVKLNSHDVQGISIKDFLLAHVMVKVIKKSKENLGQEYFVKSAETLVDLRSLDTIKLIELWNGNYTKHQEYIETLERKSQSV